MFEHIIITRFNIKHEEWKNKVRNTNWEKWMKERVKIFKKYCSPSVANQSTNEFVWLVCIDPNTKDKYRKSILEEKSKSKSIEVIEVDSLKSLTKDVKSYILNNVEEEFVITSRLDNDDAIEKNFVKDIQDMFDKQSYKPISMAKGFQLILGEENRLRKINTPNGPFMSLIESVSGSMKTVYGKKHYEWNDSLTKIVNDEPRWIQVIHRKNVSNRESLGKIVTNLDLQEKYGIEEEIDISYYSWLSNKMKDKKRRVLRKVTKLTKK